MTDSRQPVYIDAHSLPSRFSQAQKASTQGIVIRHSGQKANGLPVINRKEEPLPFVSVEGP